MDERRHSDILYVPVAASIENLCNIILDRFPEGSETPFSSWLYMNFWSSSQYQNRASHKTRHIQLEIQNETRG